MADVLGKSGDGVTLAAHLGDGCGEGGGGKAEALYADFANLQSCELYKDLGCLSNLTDVNAQTINDEMGFDFLAL